MYENYTMESPLSDEESGDEEDMAELEALLYSKVHYQEDITITDKEDIGADGMEEDTAAESSQCQDQEREGISSGLVENPFYAPSTSPSESIKTSSDKETSLPNCPVKDVSSEDSDELSDDDGIIVLNDSRGQKESIAIVISDSDSDDDDDDESVASNDFSDNGDREDQGQPANKKRARLTEMEKAFGQDYKSRPSVIEEKKKKRPLAAATPVLTMSKKRKTSSQKQFYVAAYGSDFDENFLSNDEEGTDSRSSSQSVEILEDSSVTDTMALNIRSSPPPPDTPTAFSPHPELRNSNNWTDVVTPKKWNSDMARFYNAVTVGHTNADVSTMLSGMDSKADWSVDRSDIYGSLRIGGRTKNRYFVGKKCANCNEIGHLVRDCTAPVKIEKCSMCGAPGHSENRCPENACLRCGQPGFAFQASCVHCRNLDRITCKECGFEGHKRLECPDLWRRFHMTLDGQIPVKPTTRSDKSPRKVWCCNCGRQGHLVDNCRRFLYSKYPRCTLRVVSYSPPPVPAWMHDQAANEEGTETLTGTGNKSRKERREEKKALKQARRQREAEWRTKYNTCPNSPAGQPRWQAVNDPAKGFSEPVTPGWQTEEEGGPASARPQKQSPRYSNWLLKQAASKLGDKSQPWVGEGSTGEDPHLSYKEKLKLKRKEKRDRKKLPPRPATASSFVDRKLEVVNRAFHRRREGHGGGVGGDSRLYKKFKMAAQIANTNNRKREINSAQGKRRKSELAQVNQQGGSQPQQTNNKPRMPHGSNRKKGNKEVRLPGSGQKKGNKEKKLPGCSPKKGKKEGKSSGKKEGKSPGKKEGKSPGKSPGSSQKKKKNEPKFYNRMW